MFGRHSCSRALAFADIEGNVCLVTDADKKKACFLANVLVQVLSGLFVMAWHKIAGYYKLIIGIFLYCLWFPFFAVSLHNSRFEMYLIIAHSW